VPVPVLCQRLADRHDITISDAEADYSPLRNRCVLRRSLQRLR